MNRQTVPSYVLIDNCALNWLYCEFGDDTQTREQVDRARAAIELAADEDRIRVFMTWPLLEEISGCWHNEVSRPRVPVLLGALGRLAKDRFLRMPVAVEELPSVPGRKDDEAEARRPLTREEAFFLPWYGRLKLGEFQDNEGGIVAEAGDIAHHAKRMYKTGEVERRKRVMSEASKEQIQQWRDLWLEANTEGRHAIIDDWVLSVAEQHRIEWRLPTNFKSWLEPKLLRSVWFERAYCVARLVDILHGKKLDAGDLYDAAYFWDAAYADVLVTTDDGLLDRAHAIQAPGLRTVHLRDWLPEWL